MGAGSTTTTAEVTTTTHPRTLRRWALMRDADLILTTTHLLVVLTFTNRRAWLPPARTAVQQG